MNRPLIVAILMLSTAPLYAQGQQQNVAKLKEDGRNAVGIIGADRGKTQAYCQIANLGGEIDQAAQEKDEKKAESLTQKINDLEKQLGPEYVALFNALYRADPNTKEFQDVLSMFERLDESCRH
jgi:hypothetical protein